jgi:two-component system sensor histidine kinase KdpD
LRRDWVDLREVVERVVGAARRRGAAQEIAVELVADLPLIRADAILVEQAVGNVLANALVHTPRDTHIKIDAVISNAGVSLRVTDNGPGISPELLPHIFDKFAKTPARNESRADGSQGTGLGLAIAKGIMEAHGGAIDAETPVANGRGARFVVTFARQKGGA